MNSPRIALIAMLAVFPVRGFAAAESLPAPKGCRVEHVAPKTPAARAGLSVGDVIFEGNGKPIESAADLTNFLKEAGVAFSMKVRRNGEELLINAELPADASRGPRLGVACGEPAAAPPARAAAN